MRSGRWPLSLGFASWPALVSGVRGDALLEAAGAGGAAEVYRLLVDGAPANARDGEGARRCTWRPRAGSSTWSTC
jgi:hypothetical protein